MTHDVGAILLAGGRASRMGGIDKPGLQVDGVSLRDLAIDAVRRAGADPVVVVGPRPVHGNTAAHSDTTVQWVREDPPFTGPAAAIVAALAVTAAHDEGTDPVDGGEDPEWTFVLACDLPRVDAAVRQLVDDILLLPSDTDGACLADASSRPQWLTAVYRTAALRRAAASLPDAGRDQSMRVLVSDLAVAALPDRIDGARDIDTWEDYERFTKEVP